MYCFSSPVIWKHWGLLCESMVQGELTRPLWAPFSRGEKLFCSQPSFKKNIREDQGRGRHLVGRKLTKQFFIRSTKQKTFHDFSKRVVTLTMEMIFCLIMILATGGKIQMPQDRLGLGIELIISHMWMWLKIDHYLMDCWETHLSVHLLFICSSCCPLNPILGLL